MNTFLTILFGFCILCIVIAICAGVGLFISMLSNDKKKSFGDYIEDGIKVLFPLGLFIGLCWCIGKLIIWLLK